MSMQYDLEHLAIQPLNQASAEDIFYCFRLILGRNPNPEEIAVHFARVGQPLAEIVRSYLQSLEFDTRNLLKAKEMAGITSVERNGIVHYVDPSDPDVGCHIFAGDYEPHIQAMFRRFVTPGMLAIDIGANIGFFSMLAAQLVGPEGMVIAVEPNPVNVKLIEASRRANGFDNVLIHCVAAAETAGPLVLYPGGSNGIVAPMRDSTDAIFRASIVPAVNLDALMPQDRHIGFIKIDVERYELKALKGLEQSLRHCRPVIVSEFAPTAMEPGEGERYLRFLIGLGYGLGVARLDGSIVEFGTDIAGVMRSHAESGVDHIDIVAYPPHQAGVSIDSGTLCRTEQRDRGLAQASVKRIVALLNEHVLAPLDIQMVRRTTLDRLSAQSAVRRAVPPSLTTSPPPTTPDSGQLRLDDIGESGESDSGVRLVSSLDELDEVLKECDAAWAISDDALREVFKTFAFRLRETSHPDPFSKEYKDLQFELYQRISGRLYSPENEFTDWLIPEEGALTPFPFYTKSFQTVSDHIIMCGLIIKTMELKPGAKILEFGCGFGNTTVNLSRMGYEVTAVDIEPRYLQIVNRRCEGFITPPRTVCGDFSLINTLEDQYDAILFYESFHHCADHQSLVASFDKRVTPYGSVVFASEPIYEEHPNPWGLRLDGQSLWAIRRFGWLELGFKESYFRELLGRSGWQCAKHHFPVTSLGTIFVAKR